VERRRGWEVLLFGGASEVGKTSVSYRLAQYYGVGLTEVDDFQVILEHMTTPEQQPVLHYWRTHWDEFQRMDEGQRLDYTRRYAEAMGEALELVIANHLESRAPVVLEGDFILPTLATKPTYNGIAARGAVGAVFLYEPDEAQIGRNYQLREGKPQPDRARASWCYSEWLRAEAERLGVPTVAARPWESVLERVIAVLETAYPPPAGI
jgi:2-phosphoglycerate kinase